MLYDFLDRLTLEVPDGNGLARFLAAEFGTFSAERAGGGPRLVVEPDPSLELRALDGPLAVDQQLCRVGGRSYLVDLAGRLCEWAEPRGPERQVVRVHPSFTPYRFYYYALLPVLKEALNAAGMTFVHASAVAVEGAGLVFAAWGGTGKTNLILRLLEREGATYFGDDLVIVGREGRLYPFPRRLNTYYYNLPASEALRRRQGTGRRVATRLVEQAARALGRLSPKLEAPLEMAVKKVTVLSASASDLGATPATAAVRVRRLYLLLDHRGGDVRIEPAKADEVARSLVANLRYELLQIDRFRLREAFLSGALAEPVVTDVDGRIIADFLAAVPARAARLGAAPLDDAVDRLLDDSEITDMGER